MTVAMLGMVRASWRMFREVFRPMLDAKDARWALLVGTDLSNGILAHQIQSYYHLALSRARFVGHGRRRQRRPPGPNPHSRQRWTTSAALPPRSRRPTCWWSPARLPGRRLRSLMEACRQGNLNLKIIRSLEDRLEGDNHVPIRDIEINDLLGRDPVDARHREHRQTAGRAPRHGHRGRRQHRLGNLPPDPQLPSRNA